MKRLHVDLQINNAEYKDGLLHSVDFNISTPKGNGSAQGDITPEKRFGFRYYPAGGSEFSIMVGTLDVPSMKE